MKLIRSIVFSALGLVLPLFAFAQVIATDVQCSPPGCVGTVDLATGAVTTQKIKDNTIMNVDIGTIAAIDPSKIAGVAWTGSTDGSGSGLDADLLDGLDSLQFLRSDMGLQLASDNGALISGVFGNGTIPIEGAGTRLLWYSKKSAFRAGTVDSTQWNDSNVGDYSTAFGYDTTASGAKSFAIGSNSVASGQGAIVIGDSDIAAGIEGIAIGHNNYGSGSYALAMGYGSTASGTASAALGLSNVAGGDYSVAVGAGNTASEYKAMAFGSDSKATGSRSFAMGGFTTASGVNSTAMGYSTTAQALGSLVAGQYNIISGDKNNWVTTDPLFVLGNGASDGSRSNAVTVLKNGNVGIGITSPTYLLEVNGDVKGNRLCIGTDCRSSWPAGGASYWLQNGSKIYYNSGNVGIGTSDPGYALDVTGYVRGSSGLCIGTDCRTSWPAGGGGGVTGSGTTNYLSKWNSSTNLTNSLVYDNGSSVAVGTTSPTGKFDVNQTGNSWAMYVKSATTTDQGGIYSESTNTGNNTSVGVWGVANAAGHASGQPLGVRGDARNDDPVQGQFGVLGYNYARSQTDGMASSGVWGGSVGQPGAESDFSGYGSGVIGETYSTNYLSGGGVFYSLSTSGSATALAAKNFNTSGWSIYADGNTKATGTKSAVVYTDSQGPTALYVEESTGVYFTDYGKGQLQNGETTIQLDPLFLETVTIDEQNPMMVFVQMEGPNQVYVQPGTKSFKVVSSSTTGDLNAAFSYRIVTKRKYHETTRLETAPTPISTYMRPDLSVDGLKALNVKWGLPYDGSEVHQLPN